MEPPRQVANRCRKPEATHPAVEACPATALQGSSHNVANNPANHDGIIGLYGLSWFKVFLEGDERYRKFLTAPAPSIVTSKFKHNLQ